MNHFAHLVLSQPTVESTVGNLLGDFARGVDQGKLPLAVRAGLENHRAVDRFTDSHPLVVEIKKCFSPQRRRFAGIALDMYFDHLLINDWDQFEQGTSEQIIKIFYQRMKAGRSLMPGRNMQLVTGRMIEYDWFGRYRETESIAKALDRVAGRIRFTNNFNNAIEDLQFNHDEIRATFFEFYPQLKTHISELAIERVKR
jgi:acyl carrier protein phosphodiesterase